MANIPTLRELRISRSIQAREIVAVVQRLYPKFDAPQLSKVEHGSEYGAELPADALDLIYQTFAPELASLLHCKERDRHRLTGRVSVRLTDEDYALLMKRIKADGCETTQAWLSRLIHREVTT